MTAKKDPRSDNRNTREEIAHGKLITELAEFEIFKRHLYLKLDEMPAAWHRLEEEVPVRPRKTKITADFDTETVKWFRAMGLGYQARMNQVLRTYMLAVKSRYIERRTDFDWKGDLLKNRGPR